MRGGSKTGVLIGAAAGSALALVAGAIWVALAPDDGFADLVAATVTLVVLIPFGFVAGGVSGAVKRRGTQPSSAGTRVVETRRHRPA
jgi:hypothetical protein